MELIEEQVTPAGLVDPSLPPVPPAEQAPAAELPPLQISVGATPQGVRLQFSRQLNADHINIPDRRLARRIAELIRQASYADSTMEMLPAGKAPGKPSRRQKVRQEKSRRTG